jgi:hypothetical protein
MFDLVNRISTADMFLNVPKVYCIVPSHENSNKAIACVWTVQKFVCTYSIYIGFSEDETKSGDNKIATSTSRP